MDHDPYPVHFGNVVVCYLTDKNPQQSAAFHDIPIFCLHFTEVNYDGKIKTIKYGSYVSSRTYEIFYIRSAEIMHVLRACLQWCV